MTLRPRRADDDPAIARIIREALPGWISSVRAVRHRRLTMPARARGGDWVWEADGEAVGWGSVSLQLDRARDDLADVHVIVRSPWRGRGIGSALYESANAHALELGAGRVLTDVEDEPSARRFAERRGFRHTMTSRRSSVDPRGADLSALASLRAAKQAEGFSLAPFSAFRESPELIHAVDAEASLDEPAGEPITSLPLAEWLTRHSVHPDLSHEGSFAVVHDGRPVAITMLVADLEGSRALNGFTGTLRAYRGRGLARLAKLASIAWAAEQGIGLIVTENDETNAPMLAVNTSLGYRPYASALSYVKDVR